MGLSVLCSPCTEGGYDLNSSTEVGDRLPAFRDWAREFVGYHLYVLQGRI